MPPNSSEIDGIVDDVISHAEVIEAMGPLVAGLETADGLHVEAVLKHFCRIACLSVITVVGESDQRELARAKMQELAPIESIETDGETDAEAVSATQEGLNELEQIVVLTTIARLRSQTRATLFRAKDGLLTLPS